VRRGYTAGVFAPGETLSPGVVSDVISCAGLESFGQYCTTYAHACTNDASKCAAGMCWRTMPDCDAYQRGAISALPQYRSSHAPFPRICVIFLRLSRRPSRIAQGDMMGVFIVHSRLMIEYPWCSVIQTLKPPSRDRDSSYERRGSRYQSRDHAIMSRTLGLVSGYIDTALHRVKVMLPQAQQN
jgi:hypothetical protein